MTPVARWFRIERDEWPWMISFWGAIFFLVAPVVIGANLIYALVVKRAGVDFLPYFFIISSLALLAGYAISTRLQRRLSQAGQGLFFLVISIFGTAIIAVVQGHVTHESSVLELVAFILLAAFIAGATGDIAIDKIKVVASDLFDVEQMDRLYPLLISMSTTSSFIGSVLLAVGAERISENVLFWLVPISLCISFVFYLSVRIRTAPSIDVSPDEGKQASLWSDWRVGQFAQDKQLRNFVLLLSVIIGMSMVFSQLFQYQFTIVANDRLPTEAAFNAFSGAYSAILSLVLIVFVNSFQRYFLNKQGLAKALTLPPLLVAAGSGLSIFFPIFPVVVGTIFARDTIVSLQWASYRAMLEGVSDLQRNRIWLWLDGTITATGSLFGSALVGVIVLACGNEGTAFVVRLVAVIAFLLLLVRFYLNERLRRVYPQVLLNSLKKGDFKTRLRAIEAMAEFRFLKDRHLSAVLDVLRNEADPIALRVEALKTAAAINDPSCLRLVSRYFTYPDPTLRLAAIRAVAGFDFSETTAYETGFSRQVLIKKLKDEFSNESEAEINNAILRALIALHDPDFVPFLINALQTGTSQVKHSCLRALRGFHDPAIIDYVRPFLQDKDPDLKAQAIAATWQFPWEHGALTQQALDELIHAPSDSESYRQGLYLIGVLELREWQAELLRALRSEHSNIRLTAAVALLKLRDLSGIPVMEEALAQGTRAEAHEVERLADHPHIQARERLRISGLVHTYHLHYPSDLPVSEPLRVRLVEIPKKCLEALLPFYQSDVASTDRHKIEKALAGTSLPAARGKALLIGLNDVWTRMMSIELLSHGILVRVGKPGDEPKPKELVLGQAGDQHLPSAACVLTNKVERLAANEIVQSHFAPSEALHCMLQMETK